MLRGELAFDSHRRRPSPRFVAQVASFILSGNTDKPRVRLELALDFTVPEQIGDAPVQVLDGPGKAPQVPRFRRSIRGLPGLARLLC